jgi:hypothetical protein
MYYSILGRLLNHNFTEYSGHIFDMFVIDNLMLSAKQKAAMPTEAPYPDFDGMENRTS